jgi:hypothetical protein
MLRHREPAWWVLYMLVSLMGGLFVVDNQASIPPAWHTAVQIGVVLFIYSLA